MEREKRYRGSGRRRTQCLLFPKRHTPSRPRRPLCNHPHRGAARPGRRRGAGSMRDLLAGLRGRATAGGPALRDGYLADRWESGGRGIGQFSLGQAASATLPPSSSASGASRSTPPSTSTPARPPPSPGSPWTRWRGGTCWRRAATAASPGSTSARRLLPLPRPRRASVEAATMSRLPHRRVPSCRPCFRCRGAARAAARTPGRPQRSHGTPSTPACLSRPARTATSRWEEGWEDGGAFFVFRARRRRLLPVPSFSQLWDANALTAVATFSLGPGARACAAALSPTGAHALVAVGAAAAGAAPPGAPPPAGAPSLRLLDAASGAFTHALAGHGSGVWAVAWSTADPHTLLSGGADGGARVWDVRRADACVCVLEADDTQAGRVGEGGGRGATVPSSSSPRTGALAARTTPPSPASWPRPTAGTG